MPEFVLTAEIRDEKEHGKGPVGRMRREGVVPGVVYGLGRDSVSVKAPERELTGLVREMQGSGVVRLSIGNITEPVVIKEVQRHPVTRRPLNVDFLRIDMTKPIQIRVRLRIVDHPKDLAADESFNQTLNEVTVECLPADIPRVIEVDASGVTAAHPMTVGDLAVPEGLTVLDDPTNPVAVVNRSGGAAEAEEGVESPEDAAEVEGEDSDESEA